MTRSLLVAGVSSGCGKTSVTLGLLAALTRRGVAVAPFKTGPDFIDPGLHRLACGRTSHNLDSWMLPDAANRALLARHARGSGLALIEGAMGLFDGTGPPGGPGSAAHMARLLGAPVALVADARGMAQSVAALATGYARFDPRLRVAGLILNRVGGPGHREVLAEALEATGVPLLGMLARDESLALPSRHLGLVTAEDLEHRPGWLERLADWVEAGIDLDRLLALLPEHAQEAHAPTTLAARVPAPDAPVPDMPEPDPAAASGAERVRLGLARDRAFCFVYEENLRLLEAAGAEIVPFSPLADARLPESLHGLYLPGGYPELHARTLSENRTMLEALRAFCASGRPVLAECGGFMALMDSLVDAAGRRWPMAGAFPCAARMGPRFAALGYREARFVRDTPLGPAGTTARGHEFHYSSLESAPNLPGAYDISGRKGPLPGPGGFLAGNALGSYVHLHFASNPGLAPAFADAMRRAGG
ncbi:Cobyrinate a,c-diamide synthase [Fundidesulfovibrio magnetotacticus]|uniref:Cobyrinate a,c-diamide synthase n=1 Tax=Fundidesulfovibrio magnetotacticus TaxID=2730080 RepID=A0A6V8LT92_9BACT|nr:cobyrinate a,c-diamide synthase [Fundidesulfovibrio magnetotacticus]GFK92857.1 Cobyrinate a,c-diamide synthase [Fundidesulfovibrio magnetotacticus]